jgi:hypothetical protein
MQHTPAAPACHAAEVLTHHTDDCTCMHACMQTNRELARDYFPWFLEAYDQLPNMIMRADAAR